MCDAERSCEFRLQGSRGARMPHLCVEIEARYRSHAPTDSDAAESAIYSVNRIYFIVATTGGRDSSDHRVSPRAIQERSNSPRPPHLRPVFRSSTAAASLGSRL